MLQYCWFVGTACQGLTIGGLCPGSFPSSDGEKHPDHKSHMDIERDKLGCTTSCQDMKLTQIFHNFFWILSPDPQFLQPTLKV